MSALACFDRLNTPLQAAWTYLSADMPCAAFTPGSKHIFASTPTAEFRLNADRGYVIYPGTEEYSMGNGITAIPVARALVYLTAR